MTIGKKCPACGEYKQSPEFGTRRYQGKEYLRAYCKPCQAERLRNYRSTPAGKEATRCDNHTRRADPAVYARQLAQWRKRYYEDEDFRSLQLAKSAEALGRNSSRVQRIHRILDHFDGRDGWLRTLALFITYHPQGQAMQYLSTRVDYLCADYLKI